MSEGQANELLDVLRTLSDNVARLATAEIAVAGLLQRHETGEQVPTAYADMAGAVGIDEYEPVVYKRGETR